MPRIPTRRTPTHPGEMLALEFLAPLGMTQVELAERIGVPFQRVNQIVRRKRAVTPDTSLRLARLFGTTPEFWLNLQQAWDLYEALRSPSAPDIKAIQPVKKAG
jgi:addiction module HigA family antidote